LPVSFSVQIVYRIVSYSMQLVLEVANNVSVGAVQCCVLSLTSGRRPVIIIGSHHDKNALLFWSVARRLAVQENPVVAWKFCHVVHKLLRDGHSSVSISAEIMCFAR